METKKKLMDSAFRLFADKGTEFSLNEVASEVGIQKASIYAHFSSKEDLLYAAIDREINDYFIEINEQCHDLREMFFMILNYYNKSEANLYFWKRLLLFPPKVFEQKLITKINDLSEQRLEIVKKIIVSGMQDGVIRSQDADTIAIFYVSLIHGLLTSIIIYRPGDITRFYEGIWNNFWDRIK